MAFNGSGTFIRNDGFLTGGNICQTQEATSVNRLSLRFDNEFNEIATALGACVTKNGETGALTQPLDFGSQKGINLATPSANTDAATKAYADTKLPLAGGTLTGTLNGTAFDFTGNGAVAGTFGVTGDTTLQNTTIGGTLATVGLISATGGIAVTTLTASNRINAEDFYLENGTTRILNMAASGLTFYNQPTSFSGTESLTIYWDVAFGGTNFYIPLYTRP